MGSQLARAVTLIIVAALGAHQCRTEPTVDPASCGDLRDADNQLACNKRAYRAWLSAGRDESEMPDECRQDLVALPKKCNMTDYFEEGLKLSELKVEHTELVALKEFFHQYYIELYREAHPDEPPLHLGLRGDGKDCCIAADASHDQMVQNILEFEVGPLRNRHLEAPLEVTRDDVLIAMAESMEAHFLRPCNRYVATMDKYLFGQLRGAVVKFMGDNWSFLSGQSEEFRRAVFRYQRCLTPEMNTRIWD